MTTHLARWAAAAVALALALAVAGCGSSNEPTASPSQRSGY
jgi:hypothetical protein